MAEFPAIPLWTDALLADTGHLDDDEFGRYMRLLVVMWRSPNCRIPNDPAWITKRLRLTPLEYASKVLPLVEEFCSTDGNYLSQKRLLKEYFYVKKFSKSQSEKALKKWRKIRDEKMSVSDNLLEDNELDLSPSDAPTPTPTPTEEERFKDPLSPDETQTVEEEDWFQKNFWEPFPKTRAGSKDKARAAMKKALTRATKQEIENGVIAYAASDEALKDGGQFAKGAAAWLNDDRWTVQYRPQNRPHSQPKASRMDKIVNAAARASRDVKARMDADRNAPWNQPEPAPAGGYISDLSGRGETEPDGH